MKLFGMDSSAQCHPLRVYKVWLPEHPSSCVYHAVYKVAIKPDVKKRVKRRAVRINLILLLGTLLTERSWLTPWTCCYPLNNPEPILSGCCSFGVLMEWIVQSMSNLIGPTRGN